MRMNNVEMNEEMMTLVNGGDSAMVNEVAEAIQEGVYTGMAYTVSAVISVKDGIVSLKNAIAGWFD